MRRNRQRMPDVYEPEFGDDDIDPEDPSPSLLVESDDEWNDLDEQSTDKDHGE